MCDETFFVKGYEWYDDLHFHFVPPERSEGVGRNSYSVRGKMGDIPCPSVTSISSYTIDPRRLKFGRNNPHSNGAEKINFKVM